MLNGKMTYLCIMQNASSNITTCHEYGKCLMRYNIVHDPKGISNMNKVLIHQS